MHATTTRGQIHTFTANEVSVVSSHSYGRLLFTIAYCPMEANLLCGLSMIFHYVAQCFALCRIASMGQGPQGNLNAYNPALEESNPPPCEIALRLLAHAPLLSNVKKCTHANCRWHILQGAMLDTMLHH